jgi:hypothetical protein
MDFRHGESNMALVEGGNLLESDILFKELLY